MTLARQALSSVPAPTGTTLYTPVLCGTTALMLSSDVKDVEEAVLSAGAVVDEALFAGARLAAVHGLLLRAEAHRRLGRTDQQIADLRTVAELSGEGPPHPRLLPLLCAANATLLLLEGHLAAAEHVLAVDLPEVREESLAMSAFLYTRAKMYEATGRFEEALTDLMSVGRGLTNRGWHNPALLAWRSRAAAVAERVGKRAFAHRLLAEERRLASAWGATRSPGGAWSGSDPSSLSHAPRPGETKHADGRGQGPDPWPGTVTLTPAETRVAALVAEGLSNKLVSERLSISPRTVELHLTRVYRKLDISGRTGLRTALASVRLTGEDGRAA
jgi:DNA-binding CsgD family transcriptional regulator